jgi:hypothetical protein
MTTVPLTFESRVSWRDGDDSQAALRSGLELAGAGAFLAFDGPNRASHPTDWRLIDVIADLIEAGFADRVLVGADSLDATARFATGGGPGAAGVLTHTAARVGAVNISQADSAMGEDGRPPALGPGGPQLLRRRPALKRHWSITLYSHPDVPESNWLPSTGPGKPWVLVMRLYLPKPDVLDGSWTPPAMTTQT